MNPCYSLEADTGVCIFLFDYKFDTEGLKQAKLQAELLSQKLYQSIKIYSPQDQLVYEVKKRNES